MATPLAPPTVRAASRVHAASPARPAGQATQRTVSILGAVVALAGLEHGVGEMLQGTVAPDGLMILSWPDAEAFRVLAGEPAMTVVPNLLATGILAILVSLVFLVWATRFVQRRHGGLVLMALSVALLLVGGGIGPPMIGLLLGLAATRIDAPVRWWGAPCSGVVGSVFERAWPWVVGVETTAWLGLFPGAVLIGVVFGAEALPEAVVYAVMTIALLGLPLSLAAALTADQHTRMHQA